MDMPKVQEKVIETFTKEQIKAMLHVADKEYNQTLTVRDRASELCGLTLENVYLQPDDAYIKVLGKGDK